MRRELTIAFSWSAVVLAGLAVGCGDDGPGSNVADECNPLGGAGCYAPWPSSVYQVDDTTSATGVRLAFPMGAIPENADGIVFDPTALNAHDGFSPATFLFTAFPGGVDPSNLVDKLDLTTSLADTSPTVLLNADTGERVLHFAEVDVNNTENLDEQPVYIRPATRLQPSTRYIAAIRKSLRAADGGELESPAGFSALVDGNTGSHPLLSRVHAGEMFDKLATAGIDKNDLVVAWEFTTASQESLTSDLLTIRDAAYSDMGALADNVDYIITDDAPHGDGSTIVRLIEGTFKAPQVLTNGLDVDSKLARAGDGTPTVNGSFDAPFTALVPACAAAQAPVPVILFGHGFRSSIGETQASYLRGLAQELCVVIVATEWVGLTEWDDAALAFALNDANRMFDYGARFLQGMVNNFTLVQLMRGKLATELAQGGPALVDSDNIHYYGISMGHLLGTTFLAYDSHVRRGVVQVGGGPWSMVFERSSQWPAFYSVVSGAYPGGLNTVLMLNFLQMALDPVENFHIASRLLTEPIPSTPGKQILVQMAVGDSQVPNVATETQARELGIPLLGPALYVPHGLTEMTGPLANAMVIYDEAFDPAPPATNERHEVDNGTHGNLRKRPAVKEQIDTFLTTGEIVHTCNGPCDCAAGNCD